MAPRARLLLAAGACSRRVGAVATLPSSNVATYASSGNVFVVRCDNRKVIWVLPVHRAHVTAVALHAIRTVEGKRISEKVLLLASAADGSVAAWEGCDQPSLSWKHLATWKAHEKQPCVAIAACELSERTAVVTAGMEGELKLWTSEGDLSRWPCEEEATIGIPGAVLLECVAIRQVTTECAVIAAAGTDAHVWIFDARIASQGHLRQAAVLTGHRDWVRSLAFSENCSTTEENCFFFASASKDGTARLWRIQKDAPDQILDEFAVHTARVCAALGDSQWSFTAVALLDEHTAPVNSVEFTKPSSLSERPRPFPRLVTSSMDCTVAVWRRSVDKLWKCEARFGLMGGGSAHALGFFGASFSSCDGNEVLGHNFAGALHCWKARKPVGIEGSHEENREYLACFAPGGHFAAVTDLSWDANGRYLLTCSADKTARIFAEVDEGNEKRFVEWARPQVHGHAMFAATFCGKNGRRYASGAEERMLRIFDAPSSFQVPGEGDDPRLSNTKHQAASAIVPELGLSNKATFEVRHATQVSQSNPNLMVNELGANRVTSLVPLEEDLKEKRLWPETAKLYGHGNEIACIAADLKNDVLASACKAQTAKDAAIILWDAKSGVESGRLRGHDLTVNQLRFSQDGNRLLSVSRDRSFAIYTKQDIDNRFSFCLDLHKKSAHTRLIYTCTWLLGDEFICTGSRDKCLKIFSSKHAGDGEVYKQKFESSVSALDTLPTASQQQAIIAVGFENGMIQVFSVKSTEGKFSLTSIFTSSESRCGSKINRLQWRPSTSISKEDNEVQIAVACEDVSVRIFAIPLPIEVPR